MNRTNQIHLICQFLKTWRGSKRLSQEFVYHSIGIDVSNYENGRSEPGHYNLQVLCDFYRISLKWLLQITEDVDSRAITIEEYLEKAKEPL